MRREYLQEENFKPHDYEYWFDAIDNQNTGIHSNDSSYWQDRTGKYILNNGKCDVYGNCWGNNFWFRANNAHHAINDSGINAPTPGMSDFTELIVLTQFPVAQGQEGSYVIGIGGGTYRHGLMYNKPDYQQYMVKVNTPSGWIKASNVNYNIVNKTILLAITRHGTEGEHYVNGIKTNTYQWPDQTYTPTPTRSIYIGGWNAYIYAAFFL